METFKPHSLCERSSVTVYWCNVGHSSGSLQVSLPQQQCTKFSGQLWKTAMSSKTLQSEKISRPVCDKCLWNTGTTDPMLGDTGLNQSVPTVLYTKKSPCPRLTAGLKQWVLLSRARVISAHKQFSDVTILKIWPSFFFIQTRLCFRKEVLQ